MESDHTDLAERIKVRNGIFELRDGTRWILEKELGTSESFVDLIYEDDVIKRWREIGDFQFVISKKTRTIFVRSDGAVFPHSFRTTCMLVMVESGKVEVGFMTNKTFSPVIRGSHGRERLPSS